MIRFIYKSIRHNLTSHQKSRLSKLAFTVSGKPFLKRDNLPISGKFPSKEEGGIIISTDFEMAWAFRYSKRKVNPIEYANLERQNIPILLKLLDEFSFPITWATVGHLFLESCRKGDHDWMQRIPYFDDHWKFVSGDWFDDDPYSNFNKDSAWYAPDLIELVLNSQVKHEFGCHTFSHIDCTNRNCPQDVLDDELKACIEAAKKWGIVMKSFVFPGGTAGNYNILKKYGFEIYRKNMKFDLAYPFNDDSKLLVTPSTSSFGRRFDWDAEYYVYRFIRMIDKAIRTNTIAHIWLHPSVDLWTVQNVIPGVLQYAAEQREKGKLWIGTMGQIADHINHNKV